MCFSFGFFQSSKDFNEIDKIGEDGIEDLMATIAKLDSNGVQVLPEGGQRGKTTSPQVSSSDCIVAAEGKNLFKNNYLYIFFTESNI